MRRLWLLLLIVCLVGCGQATGEVLATPMRGETATIRPPDIAVARTVATPTPWSSPTATFTPTARTIPPGSVPAVISAATPTMTRPSYTGGPPPTTSPRPTPTPLATATPTPVPPPLPTLDIAAVRDPLVGVPVIDLATSAATGWLYALVGAGGGAMSNSVVPLDPATGAVGTPIAVAAEPIVLSMSADGRALYVGSNARGQIQRLDLAAGRVDRTLDLGPDPAGQTYAIRDLVVVADAPETLAVLRVRAHSTRATELAILRDGVTLPRAVMAGLDYPDVKLLACRGIADGVFAYTAYGDLHWLIFAIGASGIGGQRATDSLNLIAGHADGVIIPPPPACLDGQAYGVRGAILGATDGRLAGQIAPAVAGQVVADASTRRLFYLRGDLASPDTRDAATITIVDVSARAPLAAVRVAGVTVSSGRKSLVRWGENGLAWLDGDQHLVIVQALWVSRYP